MWLVFWLHLRDWRLLQHVRVRLMLIIWWQRLALVCHVGLLVLRRLLWWEGLRRLEKVVMGIQLVWRWNCVERIICSDVGWRRLITGIIEILIWWRRLLRRGEERVVVVTDSGHLLRVRVGT